MKLYIDFPAPDLGEDETLNTLADINYQNLRGKYKYKTMWQLRTLEKEINEQGGMIIIKRNGEIQTKNFTADLTERINELIMEEGEE